MNEFEKQIRRTFGDKRQELENEALAFIHLHEYKRVVDIMSTLIVNDLIEEGIAKGRKEMYDELFEQGRIKKVKKNAKTKRTN